jgi:hypothetical protein
LITNPKAPPGVDPADGPLGADNPATPAFQASFIRKSNVILTQDIAFCRAGIETGFPIAAPALFFLHGYMDFPVDIKFIEGQFFFDFQRAFLAFKASVIKSQRDNLPFIVSLAI